MVGSGGSKSGAVILIQRRNDGFVSLAQMCRANGKRLNHFMKAKKTKSYIDALAHSLQMGVVDAEEGGDHSGTWRHPSLAIAYNSGAPRDVGTSRSSKPK